MTGRGTPLASAAVGASAAIGVAGVGVAALLAPTAAIGAAVGGVGLTLAWVAGPRLRGAFFAALGVLLAGYALLGRGFAYLGVPPLYAGELVLLLGAATLLFGRTRGPARVTAPWLALVAFAGWGAVCTIPYLGTYRTDALRDAVLWGYSAFAVIVARVLSDPGRLESVPRIYARWLPWFTCWVPLAWTIDRLAAAQIPRVGGTDVSLLSFKPGDAAVHLAGGAAFLLAKPHDVALRVGSVRVPDWAIWLVWLAGGLIVASGNRGGMLAIFAAVFTVLAFRPRGAGRTLLALGGAAATFGLLLAIAGGPELLDETNGERQISAQQVFTNIVSLAGGGSQSGLIGTREWRLLWWREIVDYTVFGEHFWTGKGFGVNLADVDGFQLDDVDRTLRSPHNGHLTILARAGVPGLALWAALVAGVGVGLARMARQMRTAPAGARGRVALWLNAYIIAALVNAAFDVYLEGPPGGIWFWCLTGAALAVLGAPPEPGGSAPGGAAGVPAPRP